MSGRARGERLLLALFGERGVGGELDGSWRASVRRSERGGCGEVRARWDLLLAGIPTPELVSESRNSVRDAALRSHQLGML